ncbi:GATOR complex protein NPRL3-like [Homarus americanus]|uniref:GATOR complex protein NPRL3 n=1 Tax=Homarus americanus TaxID=6706 RepID=A0A8J5MP42_HOMAM|nr:GATOR complex protein NPRL3-like [Homarus americanus]
MDKRPNPYSLLIEGNTQTVPMPHTSNISNGKLVGFSDKVMSNLFAVKSELCDSKFELKVNDVRFVGHPVRLNPSTTHARPQDKRKASTIILFNIVFALKATLNHDVVNCYHDLSMRLGLALRHEEYRCQFLSSEAKIMLAAHDETSTSPEDGQVSPFQLILDRSLLARHLRQAYEELCGSGIVQLRLNKWIECEGLLRGLQTLKPYHTLLLLVERSELLHSLSPDASQALWRLLHVEESHLTPFFTLAADADLTLTQLVGHLVYWGKATIIYPVCSTNVYVLSPNAPTIINSHLAESFGEQFPGSSLHAVMADFSLPTSLSDKCHPITSPHQQQEQVQQVLWLLKHGLLQQLHTYIYLAPPMSYDFEGVRTGGREFGGAGQLGSQGTSSPASTSIPTPTVHEPPPLSHENSLLTPHSQSNHHPDITHDALHHAAVQLSQPASESDLGSVCSDERSPSPGVNIGATPEDSVHRCLDAALSPAEKEMVMKVEAARNPEDLKLFAKLCVYFRGHHHLEEMMYRVNLRRSHLLQLIDKFRQVLITCQYPDDSITLSTHTK